MELFKEKYKSYVTNTSFIGSVVVSILFLLASIVLNFYAGIYATSHVSSPVTDIILSNTRVYDVDAIFVYGPFVLWIFVTILCLREPKRIPFVLKSIALFVIIRSLFITLTHIGPFPDKLAITDSTYLIKRFTFGGDLFFSAHTGLPFLMALVFGEQIYLKIVFTAAAILFGIVVLLGHLHYTIDVLSAFFITFSIYHIASAFFPKDKKLFARGLDN